MKSYKISSLLTLLAPIVRPASSYRFNEQNARQPLRLLQQHRHLSSCLSRRAIYRDQIQGQDQDLTLARRQETMDILADEDFRAAAEIDFDKADQEAAALAKRKAEELLKRLRVVPRSPSYFSAKPAFTDDLLHLQALLRRYVEIPTLKPADAPRIAWREYETYQGTVNERIRTSRYKRLVKILKRLNLIHPQLMPDEVRLALNEWMRDIQPYGNRPAPIEIDEFGRAAAVGRRKSSSAKAWVVEGEGEVLINGKPLHQMFARLHDRESVVWALKATQRIDKYNIFAIVHGGGTTGQAEALTLAISKALMAHEPDLKPALRRAGCVARDPRRVERKKPGRLKARKMPTWVKR